MSGRNFLSATLLSLSLAAQAAFAQGQASPRTPEMDERKANEQQIARLQERNRRLDEIAAQRATVVKETNDLAAAKKKLAELSGEPEKAAEPERQPTEITTTTTTKDGMVEKKEVRKWSPTFMANDDDGKTKFGGIEFGVGVAFSHDLGSNDRVKSAVLVPDGAGGQIVRVTDQENVSARLILESHYLFTPPDAEFMGGLLGISNNGEKNWGFGPFVAIQPGEDDIISAIGGGLMFGFRRPGQETASFNLGFGVLYDLNVKLLGEGVEANKPLPPGETEIRYREEEQSGFLIMTSYSF